MMQGTSPVRIVAHLFVYAVVGFYIADNYGGPWHWQTWVALSIFLPALWLHDWSLRA